MFDLDTAISEWRQQMTSAGIKLPVALDELESHLRDEIDQQLINGLNPEQSFQVAVGRIGSATALKTEFKKVSIKSDTTIKIMGAVGFGAFASMSVYGLFSDTVGATSSQRLLGFAAVALTGALTFVSAHMWRFLPVIRVKSLRMTIAIAFAVLGALTTAFVFNVVMPRFDLSIAQITVTVLWALQPLIVCGVISAGLIEAADRGLTSAT